MKNKASEMQQFIDAMSDKHVLIINRNKKYVQVRYDMSDLEVGIPKTEVKHKRKRIGR